MIQASSFCHEEFAMSAEAVLPQSSVARDSQQDAARPEFFRMRAQLPSQGRQDTPLAKTGHMTVILKTYAACGENELHAHPNEDHVFVVLQGRVEFHGPGGELRAIGQHEGVLLPAGTFYWFKAQGEEPLVMIRIGALAGEGGDIYHRINIKGLSMAGDSKENKEVPLILRDGAWFG
jgi:mannose-6-phosphate isomerase-like protein (cupin superfamily)